jgi:hypothetical protein
MLEDEAKPGEEASKDEEPVQVNYQGTTPPPNLLDYRHMNITQSKWARTDASSWLNVLVWGVLVLLCVSFFALMAFLRGAWP